MRIVLIVSTILVGLSAGSLVRAQDIENTAVPYEPAALIAHLGALLTERDAVSAKANEFYPEEGEEPTPAYVQGMNRLEVLEASLTVARERLSEASRTQANTLLQALNSASPEALGEALPIVLANTGSYADLAEDLVQLGESHDTWPRALADGLVTHGGERGAWLLAKRGVAEGGDRELLRAALAAGQPRVLERIFQFAGKSAKNAALVGSALRTKARSLGKVAEGPERANARVHVQHICQQITERSQSSLDDPLLIPLIAHLSDLTRYGAEADAGWVEELEALARLPLSFLLISTANPTGDRAIAERIHGIVVLALGRMISVEATDLVHDALEVDYPNSKVIAARALGDALYEPAVEDLVLLLDDDDPRLAAAAYRSLKLITRQSLPAARPRWERWLERRPQR